ncbi:MAG: type II toxin-antitoxin system HicA family toxin [Candidatus Peregrinibacteria bacterium]|nr:type II toxin-antitoxin system HicA family toxin [Candidatus Peregrinibacteria bacterium]
MPKLPIISYKILAKKLRKAGYILIRTKKHPVYFCEEKNLTIPVPMHSGDVPKGTLRAIISEMEISIDQFCNL